jgi:hypothetical protein
MPSILPDFLIDECLSPRLAINARNHGHQATHVTWMGKGRRDDPFIGELAHANNLTLVTKNSIDFRGSSPRGSKGGVYAGIPLHAGLVCINGPVGMDLRIQAELFDIALDEIASDPDLTNMALEVTLENKSDLHVTVDRYAIPSDGQYALDTPALQKQVRRSAPDE